MDKDEVLKYLDNVRSHYQTYHNHKEVSAWAGLVLITLLIGQLLSVSSRSSTLVAIIATCAIVFVAGVTYLYLAKQYELKRFAANAVAACFVIEAETLIKKGADIDPKDFEVQPTLDPAAQSSHALPKCIRLRVDDMKGRGQEDQRNLEQLGYTLLGVIAVVALARIWGVL